MNEEEVRDLMFDPPGTSRIANGGQKSDEEIEAMENLLRVKMKQHDDFHIRLAVMHEGLRKHINADDCDCHSEEQKETYEHFMSAVEYALVDDAEEVDSLHEVAEIVTSQDRTVELPSWEDFVDRMPDNPAWE